MLLIFETEPGQICILLFKQGNSERVDGWIQTKKSCIPFPLNLMYFKVKWYLSTTDTIVGTINQYLSISS